MKTLLQRMVMVISAAAAALALMGCSSDGSVPLNYWYNDGQVQLGPRRNNNGSETTNPPATTNATAATVRSSEARPT